MARFNVEIDDKIAKTFKKKIIEKYGSLRGNISKSMESAIREWCKE